MNSSFWTGLTGLLATICLILTASILLTAVWLSRAPNIGSEVSRSNLSDEGFELVSLSKKSLDSYTGITQTPLFFPDRILPEVFDPEAVEAGEGDDGSESEETPVTNLDARVAGIIISPDVRIAMVTDGKAQKTLILQEGMSLEGEQAAWKLDDINERKVSFSAGAGEALQAELELEVNTRGLKAPETARAGNNRNNRQPAANASQPRNNAANQQNNSAGTNSAAEVRRRIAERRAKLRAARERAEQERNQE